MLASQFLKVLFKDTRIFKMQTQGEIRGSVSRDSPKAKHVLTLGKVLGSINVKKTMGNKAGKNFSPNNLDSHYQSE